jgi:hypothetical protein
MRKSLTLLLPTTRPRHQICATGSSNTLGRRLRRGTVCGTMHHRSWQGIMLDTTHIRSYHISRPAILSYEWIQPMLQHTPNRITYQCRRILEQTHRRRHQPTITPCHRPSTPMRQCSIRATTTTSPSRQMLIRILLSRCRLSPVKGGGCRQLLQIQQSLARDRCGAPAIAQPLQCHI